MGSGTLGTRLKGYSELRCGARLVPRLGEGGRKRKEREKGEERGREKREEGRGGAPMMPNEDEVSLIMEGDGSPPLELWVVWEERSKHPCHRVTQPCCEVV